jgi:hypothetical protein
VQIGEFEFYLDQRNEKIKSLQAQEVKAAAAAAKEALKAAKTVS